ncbi:MAG TPA: hypothetical protein VNZ25_00380, partial [Candidatus Angelobacter sp.]|nr:hypothetical protein [Candidatus Angelobacter sp.]
DCNTGRAAGKTNLTTDITDNTEPMIGTKKEKVPPSLPLLPSVKDSCQPFLVVNFWGQFLGSRDSRPTGFDFG